MSFTEIISLRASLNKDPSLNEMALLRLLKDSRKTADGVIDIDLPVVTTADVEQVLDEFHRVRNYPRARVGGGRGLWRVAVAVLWTVWGVCSL